MNKYCAPAVELPISNPPAASLFNWKGCNKSQGKGGGAVRPPRPKDWKKEVSEAGDSSPLASPAALAWH